MQLADIRHGRRGGRMRFSLLIDREEGFLHSGGHLSLLIQSVCICQVEIAGCEIFGENIGYKGYLLNNTNILFERSIFL